MRFHLFTASWVFTLLRKINFKKGYKATIVCDSNQSCGSTRPDVITTKGFKLYSCAGGSANVFHLILSEIQAWPWWGHRGCFKGTDTQQWWQLDGRGRGGKRDSGTGTSSQAGDYMTEITAYSGPQHFLPHRVSERATHCVSIKVHCQGESLPAATTQVSLWHNALICVLPFFFLPISVFQRNPVVYAFWCPLYKLWQISLSLEKWICVH